MLHRRGATLEELCYEDGRRVCLVPEAGEEFFSQDDAHRVVGMLHIGSEALEWGLVSPERYPGTGPYEPAPSDLLSSSRASVAARRALS